MSLLGADNSIKKAPVLFAGHGSPMNAILQNDFTASLNKLGKTLEQPKAILVVSAHWMIPYYSVSIHTTSELIYDMYGFPEDLYKIQYPAPNAEFLFPMIKKIFPHIKITDRGLDHGSWSILKHLYPNADTPIMQLGINTNLSLKEHFEMGRGIAKLREMGVMIIGSGNVTHNLSDFTREENAPISEWAKSFDEFIKVAIEKRNFETLIDFRNRHKYSHHAHPSLEHYIPLLYIAGASNENDISSFPYEGFQHSTLSMRNWLLT